MCWELRHQEMFWVSKYCAEIEAVKTIKLASRHNVIRRKKKIRVVLQHLLSGGNGWQYIWLCHYTDLLLIVRAASVSFTYSEKSIADLCVLNCKTKQILCPLAKAEVAIDKCVQYEETWVLYFLTAKIHTLMFWRTY